MRFLTSLLMAFLVFASIPTFAAADVDAPMEQAADSADASDVEPDMEAFDADIVSHREFMAAMQSYRARLPVVLPVDAGPDGFQSGIWRPVERTDSTLHRNYGSGVMLIRR